MKNLDFVDAYANGINLEEFLTSRNVKLRVTRNTKGTYVAYLLFIANPRFTVTSGDTPLDAVAKLLACIGGKTLMFREHREIRSVMVPPIHLNAREVDELTKLGERDGSTERLVNCSGVREGSVEK